MGPDLVQINNDNGIAVNEIENKAVSYHICQKAEKKRQKTKIYTFSHFKKSYAFVIM